MHNPKSLKSRALALLSIREMSQQELAQKLTKYTEDQNELQEVIAELAEKNWQSDERFTEELVYAKSQKQGSLRIRQELKQKGVDEEIISHYLPDKETELQHAIEVAKTKYKVKPDNNNDKKKCMNFLAYRGFTMDVIYEVLAIDWIDWEI